MADTHSKPGLGSDNMSQADKDKIHSMGGKASGTSNSSTTSSSSRTSGAAGKTEAAKRGGQNSHRGN